METVNLADLAPILAAVLGPVLAFAVGIMRFQHLDSTKSRDLIDRNRDLIEKNHREMSDSLGEVRERLARIEGRIFPPPPHDDEAEAA